MNTEHVDREYTILENIYSTQDKVRQRDLAHIAGISLGMTNTIMKRLITKGFLAVKKINRRNIHYAVTPAGINEIMRRSYRYFKRTIKNIVLYKKKIEAMIEEIQQRGFRRIILVGKSDLDFIVEHGCHVKHILFTRSSGDRGPASRSPEPVFYLLSENILPKEKRSRSDAISLHEFLFK